MKQKKKVRVRGKETVATVVAFFLLALATLPSNTAAVVPAAEEVYISCINDSQIGKEVTVSGVVTAIASNLEPSSSTEEGIQTFEPGDTSVLTLDDGTDTIFVSTDPRLLEKVYKGQRLTVVGIYAGDDEISEGKGIIYADKLGPKERVYEEVTVKELKEFPEYFYGNAVLLQGNVTRIELTHGKTELGIDDGTGTVPVEYAAETSEITVGERVTVEGKFYRNKVYAFAVTPEKPKATPTPTPTSSPAPTPTSSPAPTPTSSPAPTPTPTAAGTSAFHLVSYIFTVISVAVAGVLVAIKIREWLILRGYK